MCDCVISVILGVYVSYWDQVMVVIVILDVCDCDFGYVCECNFGYVWNRDLELYFIG